MLYFTNNDNKPANFRRQGSWNVNLSNGLNYCSTVYRLMDLSSNSEIVNYINQKIINYINRNNQKILSPIIRKTWRSCNFLDHLKRISIESAPFFDRNYFVYVTYYMEITCFNQITTNITHFMQHFMNPLYEGYFKQYNKHIRMTIWVAWILRKQINQSQEDYISKIMSPKQEIEYLKYENKILTEMKKKIRR